MNNPPSGKTCAEMIKDNGCTNNKGYMLFGCPKSCGFCGTDSKICSDFYEFKCPIWKKEGLCESDSINMGFKCRHSCGLCQFSNEISIKKDEHITSFDQVISNSVIPDPYVAQKLFKQGF